jgi:hypothetical protein
MNLYLNQTEQETQNVKYCYKNFQMDYINLKNKIIKKSLINFFLFLFITTIVLNSCSLNKNTENKSTIFCSYSSSIDYSYGYNLIIKIDSNKIELESFVRSVGVRQYYGKAKWSYISKNKIGFKCDNISEWDSINNPYFSSPLNWNPYSDEEYIKLISDKKIIYVVKIGKKKNEIILRSDWCDCIPDSEKSIIINGQLQK